MAKRVVPEFEKTIGDRVRFYRLRAQMSQETVADNLKISFQQVQKYEKGTNRLSVSSMLRLCQVFKITPHELLGVNAEALEPALFDNPEAIKLARLWADVPEGKLYQEMSALIKAIVATMPPVKRSRRARG
jgi:transcriptional regulator with XRE-family HTH domain